MLFIDLLTNSNHVTYVTIVRVLYFFDKDRIIIATNGFVKNQQKTPRSEIELAKDRRADYHHRKEAGTYE